MNPNLQQQNVSNMMRNWNTGLCECFRDEETCWWGLWCPIMLSSRTSAIFGFDNSLNLVLIIFGCILLYFLLMAMFLPGLALLLLMSGMIYWLYKRINSREKIRLNYNIYGDSCNDCLFHCCCSQCTICQEAREAKILGLKNLDLCSGEDLYVYQDETSSPKSPNEFKFSKTIISKTSKIILYINCTLAVLCIVSLILLNKPLNIAVLLMVFIQPILILYFVYWRKSRDSAALDYVIKLFAVGFWFSTFQAAIIESLLQFLILVVVTPFIGILHGPDGSPGGTGGPPDGPGPPNGHPRPPFGNYDKSYPTNGIMITTILYEIHKFINSGSCGSLLRQSISSVMGHTMTFFTITESASNTHGYNYYKDSNEYYNDYYYLSNSITLFNTNTTNDNSTMTDDTFSSFKKETLRGHIFIVIVVLFLMAFVVAAGVEETMKHFVVRCCAFPTSLKQPYEVLVYLVAGALGFATAENIEYVFGTRASPIPGTSLFVGEILILLIRVLMPIHVICAVLQAVNLSKVLMGSVHSNLFMILLPALMLHGLFDFQLFLMGAIEYAFDLNSIWLDICSMVFSLLLTIAAAVYAYRSFKSVMSNFEQGFGVLPSADEADEVVNAML